MIKKVRLVVLSTSDVIYKKYISKAGLHATRFVAKIYLYEKVNLSNTKNPAHFLILASLLDRGMQGVNFWLPLRTIMCRIELYFGAVQLSIVSPTGWLERL